MSEISQFSQGLHEECGVFGIYDKTGATDMVSAVYSALYALQHRGQESAGIVTQDTDGVHEHKGMGLVPDVFTETSLRSLTGRTAVGHVRYSTTGASLLLNAQPIVFTGKCGKMALAHNGNLTNTKQLREELINDNAVFQTTIDSEVMALLINKNSYGDIVKGVLAACNRFKGSFALVVMTADKLIAVRDPYGIRPLVMGKNLDDVVIASETCALDAVGANYVRDVRPGEVLVIDSSGEHSYFLEGAGRKCASCIFEYVYFARPDSDIECCNVHAFRKESGRLLFEEAPADADVVIGVPDSSLSAAIGYSEASGIPYEMGLVKNRYIGRTFIQPSQAMREKGVKMKLSAVRSLVAGKRVALIDDSIVRGTTSLRIVRLLKAAGAKEVHVRIASPKMTHPCFYGVDTSTCDQLIGHRCSVEEICRQIEADSLAFLSEGALLRAGNRKEMCMACFTGRYPTALYEHAAEIGRKEDKNR